MRLSDRILARVPRRHRPAVKRLLAVAGIAFVLFELWRFAIVAGGLLPTLNWIGGELAVIAGYRPWVAVVGLALTALFFVAPVWLLRLLYRRLFHRGTQAG